MASLLEETLLEETLLEETLLEETLLGETQRAVQSSPLKSYREPIGLVAALVEVGLDQTGGLLEGGGLEDLLLPRDSNTMPWASHYDRF